MAALQCELYSDGRCQRDGHRAIVRDDAAYSVVARNTTLQFFFL